MSAYTVYILYIHLTTQHSWHLGCKQDFKHGATPKFLSAALHVKGSPQRCLLGVVGPTVRGSDRDYVGLAKLDPEMVIRLKMVW